MNFCRKTPLTAGCSNSICNVMHCCFPCAYRLNIAKSRGTLRSEIKGGRGSILLGGLWGGRVTKSECCDTDSIPGEDVGQQYSFLHSEGPLRCVSFAIIDRPGGVEQHLMGLNLCTLRLVPWLLEFVERLSPPEHWRIPERAVL